MEAQGQDHLCSGLCSDLCKCSHEFIGLGGQPRAEAMGGDYEGASVRPKGSNGAKVQRGNNSKTVLAVNHSATRSVTQLETSIQS